MKHFAKNLATDILLVAGAIIGATWLLAATGTFNHPATPQRAHITITTTHVVPCQSYLSLGAMRSAAAANIPASPSFCTVPANEA